VAYGFSVVRTRARLPAASALIAIGALLFAAAEGAVFAAGLKPGIALLLALVFAAVTLLALPAAIAGYAVVTFISDLRAVSVAPTAAGILLVIAWLGMQRVRRAEVVDVLHEHRRLIAAILLLVGWLILSLGWSAKPGLGARALRDWLPAVLLFVIVATTINRPRDIRVIVAAFVLGAALSVAIGLANRGLHPASAAVETATETEGRLQGGASDPNYLAAGLIPALVLAAGLLATTRSSAARWALAAVGLVVIVGYGASESRGGLVAAGVALVAALALFRGRRSYVALVVVSVVTVAAAWFAANPAAWQRVSTFNGGGNGRTDIWRVAWSTTKDHAIVGVGLDNFRVYEPRYVRHAGFVTAVKSLVDKPSVVHNTYLQMLVETGVIGLGLFLVAVLGCLGTLWRAAKRFDELDDNAMSMISRCVLVAALAALAASFFISNATDQRIWLLFGLGPAMLAAARRSELREEVR
jgi:O-antigen ligase